MAVIRAASTSLSLLASTSSSSPSRYCHCCPTKFRFGPILNISFAFTPLSSRRAKRMAHSTARATLGLTQPNKIDHQRGILRALYYK
ncbi:UNVERIFIED_CONTAM: Leucine aminopeptidase 2, chloroplastic [Sesamum latifolium]|uniref:Leucine aminopeptidase 2, chloroplastic n=1 Tax=Sesamum latifolium TaxID=2727402 RepID=A0AAW2XBK1_9LAMI